MFCGRKGRRGEGEVDRRVKVGGRQIEEDYIGRRVWKIGRGRDGVKVGGGQIDDESYKGRMGRRERKERWIEE